MDRENIGTREQAILRGLISKRLRTAWENQDWPDLRRTEKRYFRDWYSNATAYNPGDEVYYTATQKYYQCVAATTGNAPADGSAHTQFAYWADAAVSRVADDYTNAKGYVPGDLAYYWTTDAVYQCIANSTGNLPTDTTHWGLLNKYQRYVSLDQTLNGVEQTPMGTILRVWDKDPDAYKDATELLKGRKASLNHWGVQVDKDVPFVWITFRLRVPVLYGGKWNAAAGYLADQQVYYRSAALNGNFYTNTGAAMPGESPETNPEKWTLVEIPAEFRGYLEFAAASDFLLPQGEDEAGPLRGLAEGLLADRAGVLCGQESQNQRTEVMTR